MDRNPSNAQNPRGSMHQGDLGSYSSSSTSGRGSSPNGIGGTGGGSSQARYEGLSGTHYQTMLGTEQNPRGYMHQGDLGSYSSSSTNGRGYSPSAIGGTGGGSSQARYVGSSGNPPYQTMPEAEQVARGLTGMFTSMTSAVSNAVSSSYGKKNKEREQRMQAEEKRRHDEEMRKLEEESERVNQNRNQVNALRQENINKANLDLQKRQMEREKREQELSKRKDQERKNREEALQRERELCDQRIRAAEEKNQQLMADTKTSMEADHENFLATKAHMENTQQMESNMIKGIAGATAFLYKEMGYFNDPPENNGNQGVRLLELEDAPTCQQMDSTQNVGATGEQMPLETSSSQQVPDCFKCGSSTRMTFCSHFFCPNCHVNEGTVHCPVCQKIY